VSGFSLSEDSLLPELQEIKAVTIKIAILKK